MQKNNTLGPRVLVNGSLVVSGFPREIRNPVGKFLVYRVVDDQAWYWWITETKLKALASASGVCGHVEQIRTFEQSKGDTTCRQNLR